jgi:hypothetical protein
MTGSSYLLLLCPHPAALLPTLSPILYLNLYHATIFA